MKKIIVLTIILKSLLFSWIAKIATEEFLEWVILWGAEQLVKSTETKHDDEWFAKFKETIKDDK